MHTSKLNYYLVLFFLFHVLATQAQLSGPFIDIDAGVDQTFCKDETATLLTILGTPSTSSSTLTFEYYRIRSGTHEVVRPSDPSHFFPIVIDSGTIH